MFSQDRIMKAEDLATHIEDLKAQGKTIVTTNGIFDFVHKGHASYLEKAKRLGDVLIVAMNSDASTKRIKGPARPINPQADRAYVVASLRCVDYVTIFEQDTACEVLEILKPSIHTKGGDYDVEAMPETPIVRKHGGDVKIIDLVDGYSNSAQYRKIKAMENADGPRADFLSKR